jgi:hypothetical protein
MERRTLVLGGCAALVAAALLAGASHTGAARSSLRFAEGVPPDLRAVAEETWDRFVAAWPARAGCVKPVTVEGAWELEDRATYDPHRRLVTVRIPGTRPNLEASLVHEFAHHLEFTCRAHRALRPRFLDARGLPSHTSWFEGATWEQTPSEQFAEAATVFVLGRRPAHLRTVVTLEGIRALRAWARTTQLTPRP